QALDAGHILALDVLATAVDYGPVCVGSLDREKSDDAVYIRKCTENCATSNTRILEGASFDYQGKEQPKVLFSIPLELQAADAENAANGRVENWGDFDGNGITDLVIVEDVEPQNQLVHIFLGPLEGELTLDEANITIDTTRVGTREPLDVVRSAFGDMTGDDLDDLVLVVSAIEGDEIWIFDHATLFGGDP